MNGTSRQRVPLPLQKVFIGSSQGQEITKPPPGNVAIRTFKNILHRHRSKQSEKFGTTIQPNDSKELHKQATCPPPIKDRDDPTNDSNNSSNETVALRSNQDESVDHVPASCSGYSEVMNFDNLYSSPKKVKTKSVQKTLFTPQLFLDATLEKRGYSTDRFFVHESGYYNRATEKQQLSYHPHIIDLVKTNNVGKLRSLFDAGLSTNPANSYGEGLIHLVCRTGAVDVLKAMVDSGCDVQVSDDYGRTPLHDACWSAKPSFEIIELLLAIDPNMLYMMDVRGSCPLSYVPERDYDEWIRFFISKRDALWPRQEKRAPPAPPSLSLQLPHTRPIKDPRIVLPPAIVEMLAAGRMDPKEVLFICQICDDELDLNSFGETCEFEGDLIDDCSESSINEAFGASGTSCQYDDVSMISALVRMEECKIRDFNDSVSSCESRSCHSHVETHSVSSASKLREDNDCPEKHPIFLWPPFGESSYVLDEERSIGGGSEQKLVVGSKFTPLPRTNVAGSEESKTPTFVPHATKGTYCQPEDDSGLLCGSC